MLRWYPNPTAAFSVDISDIWEFKFLNSRVLWTICIARTYEIHLVLFFNSSSFYEVYTVWTRVCYVKASQRFTSPRTKSSAYSVYLILLVSVIECRRKSLNCFHHFPELWSKSERIKFKLLQSAPCGKGHTLYF